jgi:hypothetical protein
MNTHPCGSCWSCATAAIAVSQQITSWLTHRHRPNRGPYRRGLRRLPQSSRATPELRSLLILLPGARCPRRHKSRLGCRLNAGVAVVCRAEILEMNTHPCGRSWSRATAAIAVSQQITSCLTHRHRPNRGPYRRGLRRLPQGSRATQELRSLLILLLSARQFRRHKSRLGCRLNAGGAVVCRAEILEMNTHPYGRSWSCATARAAVGRCGGSDGSSANWPTASLPS